MSVIKTMNSTHGPRASKRTSSVILNDGRTMPMLGFGTFGIWDHQESRVVGDAIDAGFRLVDTATSYKNERGVGLALRTAPESDCATFVTTKVWNTDHGYDKTIQAFEASLGRLGLKAVDLYLIHWPLLRRDTYLDTWRALIDLRADGRARSIGVSNFTALQLRRLIDATGVVPAVNQVELHPHFQQRELRTFHQQLGIITQAWSPLGAGAALADPVIGGIAAKHGCTQSRVVLNWHLSIGICPIPKAASIVHIRDNAQATNLFLDPEDLASLSKLDEPEGRISSDPDFLDLEGHVARWQRRVLSLAENPENFGKRVQRFLGP